MTAPPQHSPKADTRHAQSNSRTWEQWVLGSIGLALLLWGAVLADVPKLRMLAGGIERSPDTVRAALLAIGTLLVYLWWTGQRLTAFKAGGVEATLASVVDTVVNDPTVPDKVKEEISEFVTSNPAPIEARREARQILSARNEAVAYESQVREVLKAAQPTWDVRRATGTDGQWADVVVTDSASQRTVYIECKWSAGAPIRQRVRQWAAAMETASGRSLGAGALLVISKAPTESLAKTGVVLYRGPADDAELLKQVKDAMR